MSLVVPCDKLTGASYSLAVDAVSDRLLLNDFGRP